MKKLEILVVDDDDEMSLLLRDFLSRQGYHVTTAPSAPSALRLMKRFPHPYQPDLVISDVMMGAMSGIDLTKELLQENPQLPIVLFSSLGYGQIEKEALACGARAYLHKPFPLSEIARIVLETLPKSHK